MNCCVDSILQRGDLNSDGSLLIVGNLLFENVGVICFFMFNRIRQRKIRRTYSKWFVDIFPHGANHSFAGKLSSNPRGDQGGCRDIDDEVISNKGLDSAVLHVFGLIHFSTRWFTMWIAPFVT